MTEAVASCEFVALSLGTLRNPQPLIFSQKYCRYKWEVHCGTDRRHTAVQIGGVLRHFPFFKAQKPAKRSVTNGGRTAVQIGGILPVFFLDKLYGLGVPKQCP